MNRHKQKIIDEFWRYAKEGSFENFLGKDKTLITDYDDIADWLFHSLSDYLEAVVPGKMKECGCEEAEPPHNYHGKDCTFFPHGWNECLDQIHKNLKE